MDISDYLRVFRRYWTSIVAAAIVGALSAWAIYLVLPASYTAESSTYVSVKSKTTSLFESSQFSIARAASYPQLAWSRTVLQPVIDQLGLKESVDALRAKVSVTNPTGTVFVEIDAQDASPRMAARIANHVATSLAGAVAELEGNSGDPANQVSLRVASTATAPTSPSSPSHLIITLLGLLVGLALGFSGSILRNRRHHGELVGEQVEAITRAKLITRIPRGRGAAATDAYRMLRVALLEAGAGELPGVIVMVPVPDTPRMRSVIGTIATTVVDGGRRAALVQVAGGAGSTHLGDVLSKGTTLGSAAHLDKGGVLTIAGGGQALELSRRTLKTRASALVTQIRTMADVSIVVATERSEPLDVSLVSPYADLTLLVVDAGAGEAELALAAAELAAHRLKPDGVVLVSDS
jgi:succinoglycan biosynthesis transport protein ExoP